MSELRDPILNAIERIGLDWLVIFFGKLPFKDTISVYPTTFSEIRTKFGNLDDDKLDDALECCANLLKREEERSATIESKAFTLMGITGIAAGFITGFAGLLLDREKIYLAPILIIASIIYVVVVISLIVTVLLAMRVIAVGDYRYSYPSANNIFQLSSSSLRHVRYERVISSFYAFANNSHIANRKATFLSGSQKWFRNSIVSLLALTLVLAVHALIPASSNPSGSPKPAPTTIVATPQLTANPTDIPTTTLPTITLTPTSSIISTALPSATPSPTSTTIMPTSTIASAPTP